MIGELAGIDQSGIMHYFPSKEALMLAVLEQADPESAGFFAAHPIQSLADVPNAMLDLARANMRDPAAMGTFAVLEAEATAVDHPLNRYFRERGERRRGSLATWFRLVSEAGLIRPGVDPDVAASSLLALPAVALQPSGELWLPAAELARAEQWQGLDRRHLLAWCNMR